MFVFCVINPKCKFCGNLDQFGSAVKCEVCTEREREGEELDMMLKKILCFLTTSKDDMALSVLVHVLSVLEGIKMATFGAQKI